MLVGCAGMPASGTIGGQTVELRVDSEVARYYLANYLSGKRSDPVLDERIDRVYREADGSLPKRDDLKKLSDDFSLDFAALYLADRITRVPANAQFDSAFRKAFEYTRETLSRRQMHVAGSADYDILIVPTYLYQRFKFTGADLAAPRRALRRVGFRCYFVETDDDGPVEANAEVIMAAIRPRAESSRRLIILSASKSGAEVALALTRLGTADTHHVAAWINAVGALQGTPTVDDKLLPDLQLFTGKIDPAGTESMSTSRSRKRFESFDISPDVLVVNYFGIPTIGSVSFLALKIYLALGKYGPNDSVLLLADEIYPGGVTLPRLGSDHIHMNNNVDIASVALAITVIDWLKDKDHVSRTTEHRARTIDPSDDVPAERPELAP